MYCIKCGALVEGNFCSKCGTPVNKEDSQQVSKEGSQSKEINDMGMLKVERKSSFWGWAVKVDITIDGSLYYLGSGDNFQVALVPGHHVITYKVWCRSLQTLELDVGAGKNYYLPLEIDFWRGGFKVGKEAVLK